MRLDLRRATRWTLALALGLAVTACGTSFETSTSTDFGTALDLFIEVLGVDGSSSASSSAASPNFAVSTTGTGGNEIVVFRAALVVKEFELKRSSGADCTDTREGETSDDDECEEVIVNPAVLDLPVETGSGVQTIPVEPGVYDEIQFDFHVLNASDPEDAQIITNSDMADNISIRVEGEFNGSDFRFNADIADELKLALNQPVEVNEDEQKSLTFAVDIPSWFVDPQDGSLFDPDLASADGPSDNPDQDPEVKAQVEDNIRASFEALAGEI